MRRFLRIHGRPIQDSAFPGHDWNELPAGRRDKAKLGYALRLVKQEHLPYFNVPAVPVTRERIP